jgi:acetylornithine aminotransferase
MSTVSDRYTDVLMNTFGPPQLVLSRGKGARVWDDVGREYVDLLGGIAVNSLGHAHPAVVEAVTRQLSTLGHISNFFASEPQVTLAERLLGHLGPPRAEEAAHQEPDPAVGKVFFTNSGAEANEAALKLTRRTGRIRVVAAEGSFHGRTMGALALTAKAAYREPFEPLPGEVTFVPYGDSAALAAAVTDETAAVVLEPIQGEAGVVEPPPGYLVDARRVTRDHGALLWLDEVQTGIGRTGSWLCAAADPQVAPDVVTLAKGLGGGLPIGACIGVGPAGDLLQPGHHGTTFGGNPVACAAALAVLDTIVDEGLLDRARVVGARLRAGVAEHLRVTDVRGRGLLIGIDVATDAARVVTVARSHGFIVNATGPHTVRLAPPLVLGDDEAEAFLAAWPGILDDAVEPDDSAD